MLIKYNLRDSFRFTNYTFPWYYSFIECWPADQTGSLDPMITNLETISWWTLSSYCQYENMKPGPRGTFTFELVILIVLCNRKLLTKINSFWFPNMEIVVLLITSDVSVAKPTLLSGRDCAKLFIREWHFIFILQQLQLDTGWWRSRAEIVKVCQSCIMTLNICWEAETHTLEWRKIRGGTNGKHREFPLLWNKWWGPGRYFIRRGYVGSVNPSNGESRL